MARIDNLGNFLTDVANAIRAKGGTTASIKASSFDTAINALESGLPEIGVPVFPFNPVEAKIIDSSGTTTQLYKILANAANSLQASVSGVVGNYIYLFTNPTIVYRYSISNDTYSSRAAAPESCAKYGCAVVGTDIYYCSKAYIYKYDTTANTHTQLCATPFTATDTTLKSDGTTVYMFGGGTSNTYRKKTYKFDPATATFTELATIPYAFYYGRVEYNSTTGYFYLIGGGGGNTSLYRYSKSANTYAAIATIPYAFTQGMSAVMGGILYLIGTYDSDNYNVVYQYNRSTNSYTQLTSLPTDSSHKQHCKGTSEAIGETIYMFGLGNYDKYADKLRITKCKDTTVLVKRLVSGCKLYTDADIMRSYTLANWQNIWLLEGTKLNKTSNTLNITSSAKHCLIGGSYATIGGK